MKAIAVCAVLAVLSCAAVAPRGADAQGFKAAFSLNGLQQFEAALIAIINGAFQDISLPDIHLSDVKVPVMGHVNVDLTEITVTGFNIPSASFTLTPPNTLAMGVSGTGLTVKLKWHWKQVHGLKISDHGDLTATPKQGDISAAMAVTVASGLPYLTATSTSANFDKIELHFSGHWDSWLYNLFTSLFSSTIKKSVDSAIQNALTGAINNSLNKVLQRLPTTLYVGGGHAREDLDISTQAVTITSDYFELANAFTIADNSTGAVCPTAPAPLPDVDPQAHQLQFFVAASVLNCAIWVPFANGDFHWPLPSSVAFWGEFIPQLNQLYPGMNMTSLVTPLNGAQPTVTMSASGVTGSMAFSVNQSVIVGDGNDAWTDNLSFEFTFGIDLWVGPSKTVNNTNDLFGKVNALQLTVGVVDSGIGNIDLADLQLILDVAEPLVTDAINAVIGAGFPLPLVPGINLVNPQIIFGDGYFGVATNFGFGGADVDTSYIGAPDDA